MTKPLTGSSFRLTLAKFQRHLMVALCGVVAAVSPMRSRAQQISYYDFRAPATNPGQTSASCTANAAASGVQLCLNNSGGGLGFIQDNSTWALQLTQPAQSQSSSVWYSIPQNVAGGFTAWYSFKITPGSSPYGDGLAFVIQNAAGGAGMDPLSGCIATGSGLNALGFGGGCLGYGGIDNSLAIEADTFLDSYDPIDFPGLYDDSHIAIQSCGAGLANSTAHYASNSASPLVPTNCLALLGDTYAIASYPSNSQGSGQVTLADGNTHQVVIVYNGPKDSPANTIYVYLDPAFEPGTHTPVAGSTPILTGAFNIAQYVNLNNGTANIGFTAATGGSTQQNELLGFTFTPHGSGNANVCPSGATSPAPSATRFR